MNIEDARVGMRVRLINDPKAKSYGWPVEAKIVDVGLGHITVIAPDGWTRPFSPHWWEPFVKEQADIVNATLDAFAKQPILINTGIQVERKSDGGIRVTSEQYRNAIELDVMREENAIQMSRYNQISDELHRLQRKCYALREENTKLQEQNRQLQSEIDEMQDTFDLRYRADMRAIKLWQDKTGKEKVWPDHTDLVVFLIEQLEAAQKREAAMRGAMVYTENWLLGAHDEKGEIAPDYPLPHVQAALQPDAGAEKPNPNVEAPPYEYLGETRPVNRATGGKLI